MYYIGICDDDSVFIKYIKRLFREECKEIEFYEQLKGFGFAYAHNSYIVNLKYVVVAGQKELELLNGERLTVSRARAKGFLEAFAVEISKKYEEDR